MRCLLAALVLVAAGCDSAPSGYDPVRDTSRLSAIVSVRTLDTPSGARMELTLHLRGRGQHPASWTSLIEVSVKASGRDPDFLGDTPTLVINPGTPAQRKVQAKRQHRAIARLTEVNDTATFEVPISELVYMLDRGRTIEINGKPWTLDEADIKVMRDLIATARADTRAGR